MGPEQFGHEGANSAMSRGCRPPRFQLASPSHSHIRPSATSVAEVLAHLRRPRILAIWFAKTNFAGQVNYDRIEHVRVWECIQGTP